MNAVQRARRNARIAEARDRGDSWAAIAEAFGLSERAARRCRSDHVQAAVADAAAALDVDPNRVLREAIVVHREVLDGLGVLGREGDSSSARVGALRSRAATSLQLVRLLAWAGLLPDSFGAWSLARDVPAFVNAFAVVADRHGFEPAEILAEMDMAIPGTAVLSA